MAIVSPADENTLPVVKEAVAGMCIQCGHCEVLCPSQALLLNVRPDEKTSLLPGTGTISAEDMPDMRHQGAMGSRCSGSLFMIQSR
jgi:ferredoxin